MDKHGRFETGGGTIDYKLNIGTYKTRFLNPLSQVYQSGTESTKLMADMQERNATWVETAM